MADVQGKRRHEDAFDDDTSTQGSAFDENDALKLMLDSQQAQSQEDSEKLANIQCVICLDNPTDLTATICGHVFCQQCLSATLAAGEQMQPKQSRCPICRHRIQKKDLRLLEIKVKTRPQKKE